MQQHPPPPAAAFWTGSTTDPIFAGSASGALDGAISKAHLAGVGMMGIPGGGNCRALSELWYAAGLGPFGARTEHDAVEGKPAAAEKLSLLDRYGEASRAPENAIGSLPHRVVAH